MKIEWLSRIFVASMALVLISGQAEAGRFTDNSDGTITDADTGFMWQKADDGVERKWNDAVAYCQDLTLAGYDNWTLPRIYMLEHLIDNAYSPTIDPAFSVKLSYYWSATESRESPNSANYINFFYGNTYAFIKDNTYYTICVRENPDNRSASLQVDVQSEVTTSTPPFVVNFSLTMTGGTEPYFYEWDFSDGEFSSRSNPVHEFADPGTYQVMVTVSDNDGAIAVGTEDVTVPVAVAAADTTVDGSDNATPETVAVEGAAMAVDDNATPAAVDSAEAQEGGDMADDDNGTGEGSGDNPTTGEVAPAETVVADDVTRNQGFLKVFAGTDASFAKVVTSEAGVLAYSFSNALEGDADWNKDGKVTARELKGYLGTAVDNLSQGKQKAATTMSDSDFQICAEGGVTQILAVGVDLLGEENVLSTPFAAASARAVAKVIADRCSHWKQIILTGQETTRNTILRALLTMREDVGPQDNFIFYYAGLSEGSEEGLNLFVYDTLPELPGMTGLDYDDLAALLEESEAANYLLLFEVSNGQ